MSKEDGGSWRETRNHQTWARPDTGAEAPLLWVSMVSTGGLAYSAGLWRWSLRRVGVRGCLMGNKERPVH